MWVRAVARYRGDNNLLGAGFYDQALVDQWLDFTANEIEAARAVWLLPIYVRPALRRAPHR